MKEKNLLPEVIIELANSHDGDIKKLKKFRENHKNIFYAQKEDD